MLTSDASIVKTPATEFVPSELRRPVYECETAPSASMLSLEKPVVDQDPVMFGPNISGSFEEYGINVSGYNPPTAPFSYGEEEGTWVEGQNAGGHHDVFFNAQTVSSIYGASVVVQPASLRFLPCIKS